MLVDTVVEIGGHVNSYMYLLLNYRIQYMASIMLIREGTVQVLLLVINI